MAVPISIAGPSGKSSGKSRIFDIAQIELTKVRKQAGSKLSSE